MAETTTKAKRPRRARGDGSIYPTDDGRWRAAAIYTDPDTGARRRKTVSAATRDAVKARLREVQRQIEATGRPEPRTRREREAARRLTQGSTVAEYLGQWLETERGRVRGATWRSRELHATHYIAPAVGAVPLADLRPSDVERMMAAMVARGLSGRSARHARATLRRALADAQRDGLVASNAAALSRPPKADRAEIHVLTADETRRLLEGTTEDEFGPLYSVAASTGLRQGEVLGLEWVDLGDLDGQAPTLTVRRSLARTVDGWGLADPKTARSRRTLELGPTTARALRRQRTRQKEQRLAAGEAWQDRDGLVFTDAVGRPLKGYTVTAAFSDALKRLGLPHVRFHDLRHGVASLLLAQGVPLKLVSEQLGHSTITITADTYAHLDREQRRQAADALERAIGGAS